MTFDEFWDRYPRKVGKLDAKRVWDRLQVTDDLAGRMVVALAWQSQSEQWQNPRYIPHPATWLRQGRWDDEPVKTPTRHERLVKRLGYDFDPRIVKHS